MWRASILALVVLLVAPSAAPARVLQSFTPENRLAEGPLLAGNRVAWEENRCAAPGACGFEADTRYRIRAAGAGGVRTLSAGRIRSLPGGSNSFFSSVSFGLSAKRFVLARSEFGTTSEEDFAAERLYVGDRAGRGLNELFACATDRQTVVNAFAVDGARVAFDPDPCDDEPVVRIRAPGSESEHVFLPADGPVLDVALAGRRLATVHGGKVQIHDTRNGGELFSARLPRGTLHGIDVTSDGRLAVTVGSERIGRRTCWRSRLWVLAPGGSALERQPGTPCWDARLVQGGLAYLAGERRPQRLELQAQDGSRRTLVPFGDRSARESFDAQGRRAAFAVGCGGRVRIRVVSLDGRSRAC